MIMILAWTGLAGLIALLALWVGGEHVLQNWGEDGGPR